eukprot:PhF_6_TR12958/c0_g1_i1/m.20461
MENTSFILESALFRMCKHLRILGNECICDQKYSHDQIIEIAAKENRVIVACSPKLIARLETFGTEVGGATLSSEEQARITKKRAKLMKKQTMKLMEVYSDDEEDDEEKPQPIPYDAIRFIRIYHQAPFKSQMEEFITKSKLSQCDASRVFTRCLKCGTLIQEVEKTAVQGRVHPNVYVLYTAFYECATCKKVYWGVETEGTEHRTEVLNYKALRSLQYMTSYGVQQSTYYQLFRVIPMVIKLRVLSYLNPRELCLMSYAGKACYDLVNSNYLWCIACGEDPEDHNISISNFRPNTYTSNDILSPCDWKLRFISQKKGK